MYQDILVNKYAKAYITYKSYWIFHAYPIVFDKNERK